MWPFSSASGSIGYFLFKSYFDIYTPVAPIIFLNFSHISFRWSSKSSHVVIDFSSSSFCLRFSSSILSFFAFSSAFFWESSKYFCSNNSFCLWQSSIPKRISLDSASLYNHSAKNVIGLFGLILFNSDKPLATILL